MNISSLQDQWEREQLSLKSQLIQSDDLLEWSPLEAIESHHRFQSSSPPADVSNPSKKALKGSSGAPQCSQDFTMQVVASSPSSSSSSSSSPSSSVDTQQPIRYKLHLSPEEISSFSSSFDSKRLRVVAGVDISFEKEDPDQACAAFVLLEYPSMRLIYESYQPVVMKLPFITGFLAFRECDFLLHLISFAKQTLPTCLHPQLILVDGNGVLHPRGFGLASHLGVLSSVPTIGVAKKFSAVDGVGNAEMKEACKRLERGGDVVPIIGKSSAAQLYGVAMRATDDSTQPIYVSVGHKISIDSARQLVKAMCKYRLPEPVRQADLLSRSFLRVAA